MKSYAEIIITPQELRLYEILNKRIVIGKSEDILIEGKVLDSNYNPVEGAVIGIKSINYNYRPPKETEIGYAITNISGAYAINIEKIHNVNYELYIYEPIIEPLCLEETTN
ncbi:hypothetical protein [Clostridium kluyveri]|uniref:hypothetical protein n=1 Tax=Clostridium kluyveri TaxID=1534 RepID=UPI001FA85FDC|nr:hypothetical protein [Clostridium kluyveri]UZQ50095.1 hypothetical protein OP486_19450 [Clostridium kluyveri]